MIAEFGVFLVILAGIVALFSALSLLPFRPLRPLSAVRASSAILQALFVTLAMLSLIILRIYSDFSVENVVSHSNLSMPLLYKIVGSWGNHEGSMLLWLWVLCGFGAALACSHRAAAADHHLQSVALAVQSCLVVGMVLFILCTSDPFERIFPPAIDGKTLNPLLQDVALAMHPPLLYGGYVGFSLVFSIAVAALITGHHDRTLAVILHPWIMAAWSFLTIGIGLGSWWAYRELGWGGWWFWDPVENASLLPWLSGTALLHANIVLKKRGQLLSWVILLAIITFALSLMGTFLVRSGLLTSVHSFASDPARGVFILAYTALAIGGSLLLFALRMPTERPHEGFGPASREGLIVINNLFVLCACLTVLLGTIYPLIAQWVMDVFLTVGPTFFNLTFLPIMAIAVFFAGLTPFMPWKRAMLSTAIYRARPALMATLAGLVLIASFHAQSLIFALAGYGLATWLASASLQWLLSQEGRRNSWPVFMGHMGVAALIVGITAVGIGKTEKELSIAAGETVSIAGYNLRYESEEELHTGNHLTQRATITLIDDSGDYIATLTPEYRTYDISRINTNETSINYGVFADIYTVIGEATPDGTRRALRIYYVPMIHFIWLGAVLMALAGALAVYQQRKQSPHGTSLV